MCPFEPTPNPTPSEGAQIGDIAEQVILAAQRQFHQALEDNEPVLPWYKYVPAVLAAGFEGWSGYDHLDFHDHDHVMDEAQYIKGDRFDHMMNCYHNSSELLLMAHRNMPGLIYLN